MIDVGALPDSCLCYFDLYYFLEVNLIPFYSFELIYSLDVYMLVVCGAYLVERVSRSMHFSVYH